MTQQTLFNAREIADGYDILLEDSSNDVYSDFVFVPEESAFGRG